MAGAATLMLKLVGQWLMQSTMLSSASCWVRGCVLNTTTHLQRIGIASSAGKLSD